MNIKNFINHFLIISKNTKNNNKYNNKNFLHFVFLKLSFFFLFFCHTKLFLESEKKKYKFFVFIAFFFLLLYFLPHFSFFLLFVCNGGRTEGRGETEKLGEGERKAVIWFLLLLLLLFPVTAGITVVDCHFAGQKHLTFFCKNSIFFYSEGDKKIVGEKKWQTRKKKAKKKGWEVAEKYEFCQKEKKKNKEKQIFNSVYCSFVSSFHLLFFFFFEGVHKGYRISDSL